MTGVYLLVVVIIATFYFAGQEKGKIELITTKEIKTEHIVSMTIEANGKLTTEFRTDEIDEFVKLLVSCSTPVSPKNLRVKDRYEVTLNMKDKTVVFHFKKQNTRPFTMRQGITGHTYECRQMENFLRKYK